MKTYTCHKEVQAAKITLITGTVLALGDDGAVDVGGNWLAKHVPYVGGYYVRYADGYTSFSTTAAFEEGYSLK